MQRFSPVAVCVPTRNQCGLITEALRSAFAQSLAPCDVVVSDDAGTDETETVVETFRASLPLAQQARLRYERSPQQRGIGGNFDHAVRLAHGEFCVKLDSDDILEPQFVEVLLEHLQKHPQAGWAHCNITNISPEGKALGLAHSRKKTGYCSSGELFPAYLRHNDTCHCVMIRKSAYEAVGGYRPEMKTCEDWLLWLEMILEGWGYCFDARPLARMRKYDSRPELMTKRRQEFIVSARMLVEVMRRQFEKRTPLPGGMAPEAALGRLRDSVARLCKSAGLHEADLATRRELFAAACDFSPRFSRRLWAAVGYRAPLICLEGADWLAGVPRRWGRYWWQKLFRRQQHGGRVEFSL